MEESPAIPPFAAAPKPGRKNLVSSLVDVAAATFLRAPSFREDTYLVQHLRSSEQKALRELKDLLSASSGPAPEGGSSTNSPSPAISMWGVPLLGGDEKADVVLLKFLRARDFSVAEAHSMLLSCARWRREFGADGVPEEDLGFKELEGVVAYMHGRDREGHPVCYNAYGVFKDRELYDRVFGDADKLRRFLRWRVQVMERGVGMLQFKPGGVNSIIQVTDLRDMPKRELRVASNQILSLFQDNYPEMVARKVHSKSS